jgi:chromosome segregation ATPase
MTMDLKTRLDSLVRRRDDLDQQRQRALGRLEEAQRSVDELKAKCRAKNVDPDNLDATIQKLEAELDKSVATLETQLSQAEKALEPFTQRK